MHFSENKSIYLQIVDYICEQIILDEFVVDEKIPSVRELAAHLRVNPNTAMRAFEKLQHLEILESKRGRGLFVSRKGPSLARKFLKTNFMENDLPQLFRSMDLLDIDVDMLDRYYRDYQNQVLK